MGSAGAAYDEPVTYRGGVHEAAGWSAVVPLKRSAHAKQRLVGLGRWRPALVVAFATDVVAAVLESRHVREVIVVGGDGLPPGLLAQPSVHRLDDVRGLNPAVDAGIRAARRNAAVGVLVLPADLPCLRPDDVDTLVHTALDGRAGVLADADGEGTAALVLGSGVPFAPAFGPGSYARHLDAGAHPVAAELPTARRDVDSREHLEVARRLGVGQRTMRVLAQMEAARGVLQADAPLVSER